MSNVLKEITINETNYQIVKMNAQSGSWLLMLLMGKLTEIMSQQTETAQPEQPQVETKPEDTASAAISFMLMKLDEETFGKVQQKALAACNKLVNGVPMPVVMRDGRLAASELEYNIEAMMTLTSQAIHLNLAPFFASGKLMGMVAAS